MSIRTGIEFSRWWKKCCKVKNMNSVEFGNELMRQCQLKKIQEFYKTLEMPSNYKPPLYGKRIQKTVATYS
jgi:hypothetical protein